MRPVAHSIAAAVHVCICLLCHAVAAPPAFGPGVPWHLIDVPGHVCELDQARSKDRVYEVAFDKENPSAWIPHVLTVYRSTLKKTELSLKVIDAGGKDVIQHQRFPLADVDHVKQAKQKPKSKDRHAVLNELAKELQDVEHATASVSSSGKSETVNSAARNSERSSSKGTGKTSASPSGGTGTAIPVSSGSERSPSTDSTSRRLTDTKVWRAGSRRRAPPRMLRKRTDMFRPKRLAALDGTRYFNPNMLSAGAYSRWDPNSKESEDNIGNGKLIKWGKVSCQAYGYSSVGQPDSADVAHSGLDIEVRLGSVKDAALGKSFPSRFSTYGFDLKTGKLPACGNFSDFQNPKSIDDMHRQGLPGDGSVSGKSKLGEKDDRNFSGSDGEANPNRECKTKLQSVPDLARDDLMTTGFVPADFKQPLRVIMTEAVGEEMDRDRVCPPEGWTGPLSSEEQKNRRNCKAANSVADCDALSRFLVDLRGKGCLGIRTEGKPELKDLLRCVDDDSVSWTEHLRQCPDWKYISYCGDTLWQPPKLDMFFSFSPQMPLVDLDDAEERSDGGFKNLPSTDGTCFDPAKGLRPRSEQRWWKFWRWDSGTWTIVGVSVGVIGAVALISAIVWKCKTCGGGIILLAAPNVNNARTGPLLELEVANQTVDQLTPQPPCSMRYCTFGHALVRFVHQGPQDARCNYCQCAIAAETTAFGCRACDFDLCENCHSRPPRRDAP